MAATRAVERGRRRSVLVGLKARVREKFILLPLAADEIVATIDASLRINVSML